MLGMKPAACCCWINSNFHSRSSICPSKHARIAGRQSVTWTFAGRRRLQLRRRWGWQLRQRANLVLQTVKPRHGWKIVWSISKLRAQPLSISSTTATGSRPLLVRNSAIHKRFAMATDLDVLVSFRHFEWGISVWYPQFLYQRGGKDAGKGHRRQHGHWHDILRMSS